jgi:signal transduction histidine kinase
MNRMPFRYLWPVLLTTAVLLGLCTVTAVLLFRHRAGMSETLRENIVSRRAAADLEEDLLTLHGLLRDRVEGVGSLHDQIRVHLDEIDRYADRDDEKRLADAVRDSYERYERAWRGRPQPTNPGHAEAVARLVRLVQTELRPRCAQLREYNTRRIEESAEEHRQGLRWLAWGMVLVGSAGAAGGLVLGYGASRALSRAVRRLQVNIRDAAGKLSRALPEIVVTEVGDLEGLQEQIQGLVGRIEQVVRKLQQREHEVLRAEQLAAVGQLAAGVAHEIRNPLTSIKMLVQAGREAGSSGLPPEDLEVIEREVRRMERSLKTFLDFARPPKPVREEVNLADVIERTLGLIRGRAAKQHVGVRFDYPSGGVRYVGDGEQLQQVLVNLVLNALDAMPVGGTLEVQLQRAADGRVEVAVLDTGPGIPDWMGDKLFQPFVSSKETGLGLGLVTSRRIVEDHAGTIAGGNRPGGGAAFVVRLPAQRVTA